MRADEQPRQQVPVRTTRFGETRAVCDMVGVLVVAGWGTTGGTGVVRCRGPVPLCRMVANEQTLGIESEIVDTEVEWLRMQRGVNVW